MAASQQTRGMLYLTAMERAFASRNSPVSSRSRFLPSRPGRPLPFARRGKGDEDLRADVFLEIADEVGPRRRARARVGEIHVITGPMFAGKTSALARKLATARSSGNAVFAITSSLEAERFGARAETSLVTHDGDAFTGDEEGVCNTIEGCDFGEARVRAIGTENGWTFASEDAKALERADVVAVDEAQFMPGLIDFALECAEKRGQIVYIAGLDGDYRRRRFGEVLDLIPMCDSVTRLRGTCAECGRASSFSRRVVDLGDGEDVVSVGGSEKYAPACRACYLRLGRDESRGDVAPRWE